MEEATFIKSGSLLKAVSSNAIFLKCSACSDEIRSQYSIL